MGNVIDMSQIEMRFIFPSKSIELILIGIPHISNVQANRQVNMMQVQIKMIKVTEKYCVQSINNVFSVQACK